MTTIKEINDTTNTKPETIKDRASYVLIIPCRLLSIVKVGGNHTLLLYSITLPYDITILFKIHNVLQFIVTILLPQRSYILSGALMLSRSSTFLMTILVQSTRTILAFMSSASSPLTLQAL